MLTHTSIILAILGLLLLIYIIRLVSSKRLLLSYSLLWVFLAVIITLCALFPTPIYWLADAIGIALPSNFIFIIGIICLLVICLSLSVIARKQNAYSKTLVQEVALLRKEVDAIKAEQRNNR